MGGRGSVVARRGRVARIWVVGSVCTGRRIVGRVRVRSLLTLRLWHGVAIGWVGIGIRGVKMGVLGMRRRLGSSGMRAGCG